MFWPIQQSLKKIGAKGAVRIEALISVIFRPAPSSGVHRMLTTIEAGRGMFLVRRILEGRSRKVWHLKAGDLLALEKEPARNGS